MKCQKCYGEFQESKIHMHHNPPQFMMEEWEGNLLDLCEECHLKKLHPALLPIIKKHSNLLSNKNKSPFWIWKYHVLVENRQKCLQEVYNFTKEWIKDGESIHKLQ